MVWFVMWKEMKMFSNLFKISMVAISVVLVLLILRFWIHIAWGV
jgi:hypothetical protein